MSLVVLGGEPLDTLEEWVRELLGVVPCGVGPITNFCAHGYPFEVSLVFCSADSRQSQVKF